MTFQPVQTNQRPKREKIAERIWEWLRPTVFGISPWFARGWRLMWVRFAAKFYRGGGCYSPSVSLSKSSRIEYPWNIRIGDLSSVGANAWVYALDKISIGKNCCIGEDVKLITGSHDISLPTFDLITKPITIKDNVWIATGAMVLPGVTIGEGAVVAAGAVIVKDVEPWTVVGGNPAKVIKKRELKND
jgi:putative colanic acid biosynthesis acetyltransferase WcaF